MSVASFPVTVSFAVGAYPLPAPSWSTLLADVDRALFRAKARTRRMRGSPCGEVVLAGEAVDSSG